MFQTTNQSMYGTLTFVYLHLLDMLRVLHHPSVTLATTVGPSLLLLHPISPGRVRSSCGLKRHKRLAGKEPLVLFTAMWLVPSGRLTSHNYGTIHPF